MLNPPAGLPVQYDINFKGFNDGDRETGLAAELIRHTDPKKQAGFFAVGDAVEAFRERIYFTKWYDVKPAGQILLSVRFVSNSEEIKRVAMARAHGGTMMIHSRYDGE